MGFVRRWAIAGALAAAALSTPAAGAAQDPVQASDASDPPGDEGYGFARLRDPDHRAVESIPRERVRIYDRYSLMRIRTRFSSEIREDIEDL